MTHDVLFATAAQTAANPPWAFQGTAAAAYPIRHCQSSRTCLWFEAVSVPCRRTQRHPPLQTLDLHDRTRPATLMVPTSNSGSHLNALDARRQRTFFIDTEVLCMSRC